VEYQLVDRQDQLPELLSRISDADLVAMDTEFVAEDCYLPDLCLLQIATRDSVYILDPKGLEDISEVWRLLVEPHRKVIVHAGREEILFAYRATGQAIPGLFDVQVAVGMLGGEYPASYGKLVQRVLGKGVPKGETRTNWRRRPLSRAQLEYAAVDVLHLPEIYDRLIRDLSARGRLEWLQDELSTRQQSLLASYEQEGWYRLSGVQSMQGKQLGIVRELWLWRDARARAKDMPARRVLRDDLIVELARRGSADKRKISQIRGLHHQGIQRFLPDIAKCIDAGMASAVPDTPWSGATKRPRPPALLQQFLTASMSYLCRTHEIAPGIVGTSEDVGKLASYWMDGSDLPQSDVEFPVLLTGWRGELVGEPLYEIFAGKKGLRVQDPNNEMPLALCDIDPSQILSGDQAP
jgi:ribonuclease D